MRRLKHFIILTIYTALYFMFYQLYSILKMGPFTSFPWWSAIDFTLLLFGPVISIEVIVYLILLNTSRKNKL